MSVDVLARLLAGLALGLEKGKAKTKEYALVTEHNGTRTTTFHPSRAAAQRAAVDHLNAHGGTGNVALAPKGKEHTVHPVPAKAPGHHGGGGAHHNQYTKAAGAEFMGIPIELDRPKGFVQEGTDESGKPWKRLYRYDYGFIPKTEGGDGEDVDVFLGPSAKADTSWWAIQIKADGSFDEFKVFLGFASFELAKACYRMHIPARFCAGWFPVPIPMIKSLLGLEPIAVIKALRKAAMKIKTKTQKIAGVSFEEVTRAVSAALAAAYPPPADGGSCSPCGPWPTEVYDDKVIYSKGDQYFEEGFTYANGAVTLAGNATQVVRQYLPAQGGQPAPVAQSAKNEGVMKNAKKASVKKGGAGDIVSLAAERLAETAKGLGKGDGLITAEVKASLDAVVALLETATGLYTGTSEPAGDDGATDDTEDDGGELDMTELSDAEKSGAIVKMTGPQFLSYAIQQLTKINAETDAVKREKRMVSLEKALTYAAYWSGANFEGSTTPTFPVSVMAEEKPTETNVTPGDGAPAGLGPAATGGATGAGGSTPPTHSLGGSATFTTKIADVQKSIEALRGKPATDKVQKGVPGSTETGLWPASYVDALPDASFLYVEAAAQKSEAGLTLPAYRHFPIRDVAGKLSKVQLAQAIKMIPTFGATPEFKADLLAKANGLFGIEESIEKSSSGAGARGDDGWADDMASPDFMLGRKPAKGAALFGFDNLTEKATKVGETEA